MFWGAAFVVVALDQATKGFVRGLLERGEAWPSEDWPVRIKHVTNSGAAFGILEGQTLFLTVMALIGLAAIYLYYRNPPFDHFAAHIAIGMLLGGAIGNLSDRIRVGEVTDFVDFPRYPAFNVADSAITIGVCVLIAGYLLLGERADRRPSEPTDERTGGQTDGRETGAAGAQNSRE